MIALLDNVAYQMPGICPYCGRTVFHEPQIRGNRVAIQCRNCGGWTLRQLITIKED